jgi:hypothetical protein
MGLCIAVFLMFYARRQNAAKERGDHDHVLEGKNEHEIKQLRHRHPDFRYIE